MRSTRRSGAFMVLIGIAVGFVLGVAFADDNSKAEANFSDEGFTKWEYRLMQPPINSRDGEDKFNALGEQGWEYAGIVRQSPSHYVAFKRPKR